MEAQPWGRGVVPEPDGVSEISANGAPACRWARWPPGSFPGFGVQARTVVDSMRDRNEGRPGAADGSLPPWVPAAICRPRGAALMNED